MTTVTQRTTGDRGYGTDHEAERERWRPIVEAGGVTCAQGVCLEPSRAIPPGSAWDLGHNEDRTAWIGPVHVRCNRSAGGRNAAAKTNAARALTVREWGQA